MADVFGEARWPGAKSFVDCSYVCSLGITPGTATLTIPPQLNQVAEVGDLTLTDGRNKLILRDCKVVRPAGSIGPQGQVVTLLIEDHRWRWQFGQISGLYNVLAERTSTIKPAVNPDAPAVNEPDEPMEPPAGEEPIRPWSKKTAPELAKLCLKAMGETRYDVSALDPNATPSVNWDAVNPAQALQQLAEDLGCVVAYRPAEHGVLIARRGDGQELPDGPFLDDAPALTVKARPSKLVLLGAPIQFQQRFPLEAVGIDFDGSIKPINSLSYAPEDGWQSTGPPYFGNLPETEDLPGDYTHEDAVALAAQSVYRMYRIYFPGNVGDFMVPPGQGPGHISIKRLEQVRLLPVRNQVTKDNIGREATAAAVCYGRYSPEENVHIGTPWEDAYEDTTDTTEVLVPFTVDERRQLISFTDYVFAIYDGEDHAAELVLECAAEIADPDTMQFLRYERERSLGGAGLDTQPAYFVAEDVRYRVTAVYDADGGQLLRTETNAKDVERRADYYLAGELRRYEPAAAGDRTYPGILPIMPDGAIMQVTWAVGGGNPSNPQTRASRNSEHALYLPTYGARRRIEQTDFDALRRDRQAANRLRDLWQESL